MTITQSEILILGENGQVASALRSCLSGPRVRAFGRPDIDFTKPETVLDALAATRPRIVINAAAYTNVDQAESDRETCLAVNSATPAAIAQWCAKNEAFLVHFSSDYVYDGAGTFARNEAADPAPLNFYGTSKLAGDQEILASGARAVIFRTSWVYSHIGRNFVNTILRLASEREELRIVDDQVGAPTYAPDIAKSVADLLSQPKNWPAQGGRVFHLCNHGFCSWLDFAKAIVEEAQIRDMPVLTKSLEGIPTSAYPTPARRPLNSRLDLTRARTELGIELPPWRTSLQRCLDKISEIRGQT